MVAVFAVRAGPVRANDRRTSGHAGRPPGTARVLPTWRAWRAVAAMVAALGMVSCTRELLDAQQFSAADAGVADAKSSGSDGASAPKDASGQQSDALGMGNPLDL